MPDINNDGLKDASKMKLPATTLTEGCYAYMFYNCQNLTTVPEDLLPATTRTKSCYGTMFAGTGITKAPYLPAITTSDDSRRQCYMKMFDSCSNLSTVKCNAVFEDTTHTTEGPETQTTNGDTFSWLKDVSTSGTFYKNSSCTEDNWTRGMSGIPEGWTVNNL